MYPSGHFAASTSVCSSSTELQLLLPFVTYCGRFLGNCPLTGRSSIADIYCYRCSCIAPGNITEPSSW